jgi:hypothetical protein
VDITYTKIGLEDYEMSFHVSSRQEHPDVCGLGCGLGGGSRISARNRRSRLLTQEQSHPVLFLEKRD